MNDHWRLAAEQLALVLEQENRALAVLDLPGAAAILPRKTDCIAVFEAQRADLVPADHATAVAILERLSALTGENRRLLDRGIAAQQRVIGMMAQLVRQTPAAPRYGAGGALRSDRLLPAFTVSSQA